ncbi:MAG: serine/threonine protein kinase [Planctomycetia bacterium]|nr:serine/threonine protein kinase [Planctomycetia bacterium]
MSKLSLDKFVELVERSKLIPSDQLSAVVADWKSQATLSELDDARHCAAQLVERGLLTHWQARKLLEGRHRGFYLGRYKLLDHLGSGGMSSVYLAEHVLMQRRVAIKVLPHNRVSDSSYLARFHLEAQAAAALDHRNIVRAYDLDNEGKIHYLVMEYIEGRDLHAMVCQDGPLDYHVAANYIAQAATGLDHAHHCGLIHRDIKPANLLVDRNGTVKILDMGLAKFTGGNRPNPGFAQDEHVLGTADYLAPEQAVNSQTVDERADIYALGCTLYFLLTGHPPFAVGTSIERMTAHQQQLAPSVVIDRPDAPAALVAICRRMMEKSPENRYQTASEACQALGDWLQSEEAAGKIVATAAVATVPGAAGRRAFGQTGLHEQPKSKANLVSGSASDLYRVPQESPQASSPLTDTDPNLHRATVKIPAPFAGSGIELPHAPTANQPPRPVASQPPSREAVSAPEPPIPPPVMGPPPSSNTLIGSPQRCPDVIPPDVPAVMPAPIDSQLTQQPIIDGIRRQRKTASTGHWLSIMVLSALVLIALLLALFTLPN